MGEGEVSPRPITRRLLNSTATVKRPTTADDSQGGHERSYPTLKSDVPCRIRPLSLAERSIGHREEVKATHRVYTLPDEDIRRSDRLAISGVDYDVMYPRNPSELNHHNTYDVRVRVIGG
jgi:SPP1 family predicted phage head-tail adaptor